MPKIEKGTQEEKNDAIQKRTAELMNRIDAVCPARPGLSCRMPGPALSCRMPGPALSCPALSYARCSAVLSCYALPVRGTWIIFIRLAVCRRRSHQPAPGRIVCYNNLTPPGLSAGLRLGSGVESKVGT